MQKIASALRSLILVLALIAIAYGALMNYSLLFARDVKGEVLEVAGGLQPATMIAGGMVPATQVYSFAISIKEPNGEIMVASSEDRQWAVAKKGMCVEAKFYPYPPWNLEKAGSFHGARLLRLLECGKSAPAAAVNATATP